MALVPTAATRALRRSALLQALLALTLSRSTSPTLASATLLGGGTAKAIADASAFLKEQGKIPAVLADYGPYVNKSFVDGARGATN